MKCSRLPHVGCSLVCGSMDPSEANLNLWIELTLFLRSGSFAVVFPWVVEAWWRVWVRRAGVAGLGGAAAPGGSAGPGDAAGPATWLLCCSLVVCLLGPARLWWVRSFGSRCTRLYSVWTCIEGQGRAGRTTRCGRAYHMCLDAPELPPNLGPADKNSIQLLEPCWHLKHAWNSL
jgi:hypothetical protein